MHFEDLCPCIKR